MWGTQHIQSIRRRQTAIQTTHRAVAYAGLLTRNHVRCARLALVCATAIVLAACSSTSSSSSATNAGSASQAPVKLTALIPTEAVQWAPFYIAKAEGFFAKQGLDVTFDVTTTGPVSEAAFASGCCQVGIETIPLMVQLIAKGQDLKIVGEMSDLWDGALVLSNSVLKRDHLTASSPLKSKLEALRGLTIADFGPKSLDDEALRYLASTVHLNPQTDFTITTITSKPGQLSALAHNTIQGFFSAAPGPEEAEAQGIGTIVADLSPANFPNMKGINGAFIGAYNSYLQSHAGVLKRFVTAVAEGNAYAQAHPSKVENDIYKYYPGFTRSVFDASFKFDLPGFVANPYISQDTYSINRSFARPPVGAGVATYASVVKNLGS